MELRHALQATATRCKVCLQVHVVAVVLHALSVCCISWMRTTHRLQVPFTKTLFGGNLHSSMGLPEQEKEVLAAELTEVAQRQRAKIGALARERAELAARPTADPAQLEALRSEAAALQERLVSFTAAKAGLLLPLCQEAFYKFLPCICSLSTAGRTA